MRKKSVMCVTLLLALISLMLMACNGLNSDERREKNKKPEKTEVTDGNDSKIDETIVGPSEVNDSAEESNDEADIAVVNEIDRSFEIDYENSRLIVEDDLDFINEVEYEAKEAFRRFLINEIAVNDGNEDIYISSIIRNELDCFFEYYDESFLDEQDFSDGEINFPNIIEVYYIALDTKSGPKLFVDAGVKSFVTDHTLYQIAYENGELVVDSSLIMAWCDSISFYGNDYAQYSHGQHFPAVSCFYFAERPLFDMWQPDNDNQKVRLVSVGPREWFVADDEIVSDEVIAEEYISVAEEVFIYSGNDIIDENVFKGILDLTKDDIYSEGTRLVILYY